jgi:hypothetical protein
LYLLGDKPKSAMQKLHWDVVDIASDESLVISDDRTVDA